MNKFDVYQKQRAKLVEKNLSKYISKIKNAPRILTDAMDYSLQAGGKRVRPILLMATAEAFGKKAQDVLPAACAVEMLHTYSLIHDDLPCMDDDDMRRGKPSNHKVYGEATALLAGDALQSLAFETMLSDEAVKAVGADKAARAAGALARAIGAYGMVGGQIIDLAYENKSADEEIIREMHRKKTGALIRAACEIGCIIGGADESQIKAAQDYAESIGLAFQIVDDILDVTSDEKTLGKPIGSDADNSKSTFVTLYGVKKCVELVNELTDRAVNSLNVFSGDTSSLKELAYSLAKRKN